MPKRPFEGRQKSPAFLLRDADRLLVAEIHHMQVKLCLRRSSADIAKDIKAALHTPLPPHGFTVLQTLCERERAKVYNQSAAEMFADTRNQFGEAIRDLAISIEGKKTARKARKLANNAWKWDRAADRRALRGSTTPYGARPEVYDRDVVWIFADAIALVADRTHLATGHHGDVTLRDGSGGPMLRVLVAAVQWAMTAAFQSAASPGAAPPRVRPEGILNLIKRGR